VPSTQDSVHWPTATTTAASCCPSSVPLTAAATRAPSCSVYANIVARASNAQHTTFSPAVRALLLARQHAVPSSAESLVFAVTSQPHTPVAYPLLARLHLNIATPHHTAIHLRQRRPLTGELRRSSARLPCLIRACRTTRIRRACAMGSPSPPPSKHQSLRLQSATSRRGGGSLANALQRRRTRQVRPLRGRWAYACASSGCSVLSSSDVPDKAEIVVLSACKVPVNTCRMHSLTNIVTHRCTTRNFRRTPHTEHTLRKCSHIAFQRARGELYLWLRAHCSREVRRISQRKGSVVQFLGLVTC
jgi:hypothetical protein